MPDLSRPYESSAETAARGNAERVLAYVVAGMTCDHCKVAVTEEVAQVAGVTSVDVELETKLVRVRGTDVDGAAVVAAIDEAGYDAVAS
jgi:copper chaperone